MQTPETDIATLDLAAIAVRVRQLMLAADLDGTDFASRVGVPYGTMRAYVTGTRAPSAEFLTGCYRAFGFFPAWVLTGDGPMAKSGALAEQPAQPWERDLVAIPRFDIHASAGAGAVNEPAGEYNVDALCVSRGWLNRRRLSPTSLRAIQVRGNSMQTMLADGDLVVMDLSDTKPRSGFVYVIRHGDELLVKYCEQMPNATLRISSANPAFAPYDVDLAKSPDFVILGRVVASMHDW